MNSTERTAIEALSANVLDTRFENFDKATIEKIKNRIIDVVGCAIGGANDIGNPELVDLVKKWGGEGEATIWVHGGKAPAHNVAMVNSVMARSYDFEEQSGSHQSGTTVPTAISMAEALGVNGKELLTALLAGTDLGNRIRLAFDFDFFQGPDGIGSLQPFAATAIAGRLLGLNKLQMRHAFGIVLNQLSGTIQCYWDGATPFKLVQGLAAQNGIVAAELAKVGWTGVIDALNSRFGYYTIYTHACTHPEMLTKDLGKEYHIGENTFDRYPCGMPNHIAIEAALALVNKHDINAVDIEEVTVSFPRRSLENYYGQQFRIRDFPHGDAVFSYQYTVATSLLNKSCNLENFTEDAIRDPKVNALIGKTKLAELPGMENADRRLRMAEVRVRMKDGREFSELADAAKGAMKPMPKDELIAKFMHQVEFSQTVTKENAEKLLSQLDKLEEVDNVNKIVELLVKRK